MTICLNLSEKSRDIPLTQLLKKGDVLEIARRVCKFVVCFFKICKYFIINFLVDCLPESCALYLSPRVVLIKELKKIFQKINQIEQRVYLLRSVQIPEESQDIFLSSFNTTQSFSEAQLMMRLTPHLSRCQEIQTKVKHVQRTGAWSQSMWAASALLTQSPGVNHSLSFGELEDILGSTDVAERHQLFALNRSNSIEEFIGWFELLKTISSKERDAFIQACTVWFNQVGEREAGLIREGLSWGQVRDLVWNLQKLSPKVQADFLKHVGNQPTLVFKINLIEEIKKQDSLRQEQFVVVSLKRRELIDRVVARTPGLIQEFVRTQFEAIKVDDQDELGHLGRLAHEWECVLRHGSIATFKEEDIKRLWPLFNSVFTYNQRMHAVAYLASVLASLKNETEKEDAVRICCEFLQACSEFISQSFPHLSSNLKELYIDRISLRAGLLQLGKTDPYVLRSMTQVVRSLNPDCLLWDFENLLNSLLREEERVSKSFQPHIQE